jgi:hypothetical protein
MFSLIEKMPKTRTNATKIDNFTLVDLFILMLH